MFWLTVFSYSVDVASKSKSDRCKMDEVRRHWHINLIKSDMDGLRHRARKNYVFKKITELGKCTELCHFYYSIISISRYLQSTDLCSEIILKGVRKKLRHYYKTGFALSKTCWHFLDINVKMLSMLSSILII